jgi:hypothetical protein
MPRVGARRVCAQHARARDDAPVKGDAPLLPASVPGGRAGVPTGVLKGRAVDSTGARGKSRIGARRARDQQQRRSLGMRPRRGTAGARSARQRARVRADARELRWRLALRKEARPPRRRPHPARRVVYA